MNNDSFLIEESDLELARHICKDIDDSQIRNRAMANALVSDVAKKYFKEIEYKEQCSYIDTNLLGKDILHWLEDNGFGTFNLDVHRVEYAFYAGFTFKEEMLKNYTAQKVFKKSKYATEI